MIWELALNAALGMKLLSLEEAVTVLVQTAGIQPQTFSKS